MFTLPETFTKFLTKLRHSVAPAKKKTRSLLPTARPWAEALEDRQLMTVAFQPVFGNQFTNYLGGAVMQTPHVYPIFWGSYWADHYDEMNQIGDQFKAIASFGASGADYLSGLKQYNASGAALIFNPTIDASSDPPSMIGSGFNNPSSEEIDKVIYHEPSGVPTPGQVGKAPIYVVVTPPNVVGNGDAGFNEPGIHEDLFNAELREEIWVSTGVKNASGDYVLSIDKTVEIFSHELVEATTDPLGPIPGLGGIYVNPGASFPNSGTGHQIGDNEPDGGNYLYRLGGPSGPLVQAYWSQKDKQYIVPDGNSLNMKIVPDAWAKSNSGNYYFNGGTLVIDAKQAGIPQGFVNQVITIDTIAMPGGKGVQVVMDGQTFDFEAGQITKIQLNAANDSETITINGTPSNVPVALNLGTGKYLLNIDPASASDKIQSPITVKTLAGATLDVHLAPTGSLDNLTANVQITGAGPGSKVSFKIPDGTSFSDALTGPHDGALHFSKSAITYTKFDQVTLGSYGGTLGDFTLTGGSFINEVDTVSGAGSGSFSFDGGILKFSNVTAVDDLVHAKSATYTFTGTSFIGNPPTVKVVNGPHLIDYGVYDIYAGSLQQTFLGVIGVGGDGGTPTVMVPVNFAYKTNVTLQGGAKNYSFNVDNTVPAEGLSTMTIDPGKGTSTVNVAGTCVATTITNSGLPKDVETVTLNSPSYGVQHLYGSVNVQNPHYAIDAVTLLVIDDSADVSARTVQLGDFAMTGLAPGKISYGNLDGLTVSGGSGGNSFILSSHGASPKLTLNAGAGNDTVDVQVSVTSNFLATIDGGAGVDQLIVAGQAPNTVIQQGATLIQAHTPNYFQKSNITYSNFENVSISQGAQLPKNPMVNLGGAAAGNGQYGLDSFYMALQDQIDFHLGRSTILSFLTKA